MPAGFETRQIAESRRDELLRILRKEPHRFARVIRILDDCSVRTPCGLRICDVCMRKTRLDLVREGCAHFQSLARSREVIAFSIILWDETGQVDLGPPELPKLRSRLEPLLDRLPLPVVKLIAGLDVSLNQDGRIPEWQVRLCGITHAANEQALRDTLGGLEGVERIRTCTNLGAALTDALKMQFVRRISYADLTGRRYTHKRSLSASEERVVAWWLREAGCWGTLFFQGFTRRGERLVPLRR
jgi:hypothetical protein